jgi:hypothetical protein
VGNSPQVIKQAVFRYSLLFTVKGESMKKIIVVTALLCAVIRLPGYAQSWTDNFRLNAWGKGVISPIAVSGEDSSVSAATTTSGNYPQVGFSVEGTAPGKKIGFLVDAYWDGGMPGVGDNAKIWVQPFGFIKLTAGWFIEDDLRGTVGNTEFASWLLPASGKDEDAIFTRFQAKIGAHVKLEPLYWLDSPWKGLMIEGAFGSSVAPAGSNNGDIRANRNLIGLDATDVYKGMQIGFGYKIPQVGFARFQFIGNKRAQLKPDYTNNGYPRGQSVFEGLSKNSDADVIEAAFQFSRIEGLNVDAGVKIPFEYTTDTQFIEYPALPPNGVKETADLDERIVQRPLGVALGVNWTPSFLESLNLVVLFDISFGGTIEETSHHLIKFGANTGLWVMPSYKITEVLKAGVDFGMYIHQKDEWQQPIGRPRLDILSDENYIDIGIGPWVELSLGGGRIRTGPMIMLPGAERYLWVDGNSLGYEFRTAFTTEPVISLPISFTYNF